MGSLQMGMSVKSRKSNASAPNRENGMERQSQPAATNARMIDPFGRTVSYLRVSVTDRCDFRCVYCMAEDMTFLPKRDVLSLDELDRVCSTFVHMGVRKLRLTGGEPL